MEWVVGLAMAGLIALLIHQQRFYASLVKELCDRLMARDLTDFERAKNPPPPRVIVKNEPPTEDLSRILG